MSRSPFFAGLLARDSAGRDVARGATRALGRPGALALGGAASDSASPAGLTAIDSGVRAGCGTGAAAGAVAGRACSAAGLDPRARVELRELLRVLAGQGKAILISSHILTELAEICNGAVIIEQGKLLMAGAISDLLSTDGLRRTVMIRSLERPEDLVRDLLEMPHVESASPAGGEVVLEVNGSDEVCSEILIALVQRGHKIVEFKQLRAGLEDIFMNLTKGDVQ